MTEILDWLRIYLIYCASVSLLYLVPMAVEDTAAAVRGLADDGAGSVTRERAIDTAVKRFPRLLRLARLHEWAALRIAIMSDLPMICAEFRRICAKECGA